MEHGVDFRSPGERAYSIHHTNSTKKMGIFWEKNSEDFLGLSRVRPGHAVEKRLTNCFAIIMSA